jgi:xylan 1,4-beta-xylosidase
LISQSRGLGDVYKRQKLYGSIMVYGKNEYYFNGMDKSDAYYFQIEAFNNNGIGPRGEVKKAD